MFIFFARLIYSISAFTPFSTVQLFIIRLLLRFTPKILTYPTLFCHLIIYYTTHSLVDHFAVMLFCLSTALQKKKSLFSLAKLSFHHTTTYSFCSLSQAYTVLKSFSPSDSPGFAHTNFHFMSAISHSSFAIRFDLLICHN